MSSKAIKSILPPAVKRGPSQYAIGNNNNKALFGALRGHDVKQFRDALTISTWLTIGAALQSALFFAFGRLSLFPAICVIIWKVATTYLQVVGVLKTSVMDGVIKGRTSGLYPNEDGTFDRVSGGRITVLHIGARVNHPLGILAPGYDKVGYMFTNIYASLEERASDYGFLGGNTYLANERQTQNEILHVMYFNSTEGLHKLAHDPLHREAWDWWNKGVKEFDHIAIYHEIYEANHWESVYLNCAPSLLGASTFERTADDGTKIFVNPLVDFNKSLLGSIKSSRARMGREEYSEKSTFDQGLAFEYNA